MKFIVWILLGLASWALLIGLLAVCVRVAGTPDAWKVGLLVVASLPIVGFATRERR